METEKDSVGVLASVPTVASALSAYLAYPQDTVAQILLVFGHRPDMRVEVYLQSALGIVCPQVEYRSERDVIQMVKDIVRAGNHSFFWCQDEDLRSDIREAVVEAFETPRHKAYLMLSPSDMPGGVFPEESVSRHQLQTALAKHTPMHLYDRGCDFTFATRPSVDIPTGSTVEFEFEREGEGYRAWATYGGQRIGNCGYCAADGIDAADFEFMEDRPVEVTGALWSDYRQPHAEKPLFARTYILRIFGRVSRILMKFKQGNIFEGLSNEEAV